MTDGHHSLAAPLALDDQFQVLTACLARVNDLVLITEAEPIDLPGPRILYANNALMRLTGFTRDEVLGQTPRIFQGPRTQREVLAQIRDAMMQWRPSRVELINYTKQREEIWIELDIAPVADANGWYTHWVSIARDITARKRAEAALASTRALAATTLDALPMPVCVLDDDGRIVSINRAWREFGEANQVPEAGLGSEYFQVCHSATDAAHGLTLSAQLQRVLSGELRAFELEFMCTSFGGRHWYLAQVSRFEDGGEPRIVVIHNDISHSKRAQLNEARQTEIMRLLAERESLPQILETLVRHIEADDPRMLCSIMLLDATGLHLQHGAAPSLPAFFNNAMHGLRIGELAGSCGRACSTGIRVITPDLREDAGWTDFLPLALRADLLSCWSEPIRDSQGRVLGTFAVYHREVNEPTALDIDTISSAARFAALAIERARAELALQAQSQRTGEAQRMESLGRLAGGIAHDFNNILAIILGYVSLAQLSPGNGAGIDEKLEQIEKAGQRAVGLVRQILVFSRRTPANIAPLALGEILGETRDLLRATIPAGVELVTRVEDGLPLIEGDATQIHQILMNLCTNAWRAIESGNKHPGRIDIALQTVELTSGETEHLPVKLVPGTYVQLSVADNGVGMSDEVRSQIFEPFFTTRDAGEGTGLGLSVVHGIVSAHHGTITVESQPTCGTIFRVLLPSASPAVSATSAASGATEDAAVARRARVLFVDDEPQLVKLIEDLLPSANHEVFGYTDSRAALAAFIDDPLAFDALVCDFNMPQMSGIELARAAVKLRPALPVVLVSGNVTAQLRRDAEELGVRRILDKPDLVRDIRATLDAVLSSN